MKFILLGTPESTNNIYKTASRGRFKTMYMTAKGKEVKEYYGFLLRAQYLKQPSKNNIEVEIHLFFSDKRRRDIDNYNKLILDSATGILWEDDSQITKLLITKQVDKKNPRIELIFNEAYGSSNESCEKKIIPKNGNFRSKRTSTYWKRRFL